MKKLKVILSLLLCFTLLLSLAACNKNTDSGNGGSGDSGNSGSKPINAKKVKLDHVYSSQKFDADLELNYIERCVSSGDVLYLKGSYDKSWQEGDEWKYEYKQLIYSMDSNFENIKEVLSISENESTYEGSVYDYTYVSGLQGDGKGSVWTLYSVSHNDYSDPEYPVYETYYSLVCFDRDGNELNRIDKINLGSEDEYFYINSFAIVDDYIVFYSDALYFTDMNGNLVFTINVPEDQWIEQFFVLDGKPVVGIYGSNPGMDYKTVNLDSKTWGESYHSDEYYWNSSPANDGMKLYVQDTSGLCAYDLATGEKKEVINWLNSDINSAYLDTCTPLSDGKFLIVERRWNDEGSNTDFSVLFPVNEGDIVEKYVLTYACTYLDSNVTDQIIAFNRSHDEYRIVAKIYETNYDSDTDSWTGGMDDLTADLTAGNIPDIIAASEFDFKSYVSKGILEDLTPYLDLSSGKYLDNVITAGSIGGKLYSLIPSFNVQTVIAKKSLIGDRTSLTYEDVDALLKANPGSVSFAETSRLNILTELLNTSMDYFVDSSTGKCNFTDGAFASLLKFCNSFPEEINWDELYGEDYDWQLYDSQYKENRTLFQSYWVSSFEDVRYSVEQFGEPIAYIGYPCQDGSGSVIYPQAQYSLSAKSPFKDIAWDFLKLFISEDYQDSLSYAFPVLRSSLDKMADKALHPETENNGIFTKAIVTEEAAIAAGDVAVPVDAAVADIAIDEEYDDYEDEVYYWNRPLTQEEVDNIVALVTGVTKIYGYNNAILNIIQEEAAPFFAGQKTAEDVSGIIQSRVFIYASENS